MGWFPVAACIQISVILTTCYNLFVMTNAFLFFSPQDEFLDVIYWFRQVLAIVLGIIWGILPLKGILAIGL